MTAPTTLANGSVELLGKLQVPIPESNNPRRERPGVYEAGSAGNIDHEHVKLSTLKELRSHETYLDSLW